MQHNCYTCKYRSEVPGSVNSSCNAAEDKLFVAAFVAQSSGNFPNLKLNQHGMKNGWAFWPVDFDPCWVERCNFYERKDK